MVVTFTAPLSVIEDINNVNAARQMPLGAGGVHIIRYVLKEKRSEH